MAFDTTDRRASSPPLATAHLLALSLPTAIFAGYDLARRSFLAAYLSWGLGLPIGTVGWLVTLANFASIPAEGIAGALCDRGLAGLGRRVPWMLGGTIAIVAGGATLLALDRSSNLAAIALALVALVGGWAVCNVTHGAWALEASRDRATRARVFGWRTLAGIAGAVGFSALGVLQNHRLPSPFTAILLAISIGAPLAHAALILLVPDRGPSPRRWRPGLLFEPLRLLFANPGNRRLATLFALNGAHTAITGTGYLYIVGSALALPGWGPTGILVQTVCAGIGIGVTLRFGTRVAPARLLAVVLTANLLLALALIALPPQRPALLIAWTAVFGLFSAIDFMALRLLLGERLDAARETEARAAAHYAGFHLPFNLCGAAAAGALFLLYHRLGFDPTAHRAPEHMFLPVLLAPTLLAALLMAASLAILRMREFPASAPTASHRRTRLKKAEQL